MEFLVHMEVARIEGGEEREEQLREQEAARSRELARQGLLVRLWRVPGRRENWGIWRADDADQLHAAFVSLPLFSYLTDYRSSPGIPPQRPHDATNFHG